jgi:FkbM family methyltransferase
MKIGQYLNKPEYIFRPSQLFRRMWRAVKRGTNEFETVTLPWEIEITVRPNETIGHSIVTLGVYDLGATEVLWRLIDLGETTVDIGANIGYMTSVMAKRVGETGRVFSYEPHSEIYDEFCENKRKWQEINGWYHLESQKVALSNTSGIGTLNVPPHFTENRGVASLLDARCEQIDHACQCPVALATLDDLMNDDHAVAVIKIDVEGHELKVLQGGAKVIMGHVRDIVFEEHGKYPSEVTSYLENCGFKVFRFYKEILGPRLQSPAETPQGALLPWESPNYLATKDPSRAISRMEKRGWQAFSSN